MTDRHQGLTPTDAPPAGAFEAIFKRLDEHSRALIGPAVARPLVIPLRDAAGSVAGGFWGITMFQWLHVQMLFIPESRRRRGLGTAIMIAAEDEARARGCRASCVDTFEFQAVRFYEKLGYAKFGVLHDYPPGHERIYFHKTIVA